MTAIEQEVPSRELCEELRDLGWPQEGSLFWWVYKPIREKWSIQYGTVLASWASLLIAAPTVGEMGRWLEKADKIRSYDPNHLAERIIFHVKMGHLKIPEVRK